MKYKIGKQKLPIEIGFNMEVRKLRQDRPELSILDCKFQVLSTFEEEVVLSDADREWCAEKKVELIGARASSRRKSKKDMEALDKLVDDLFK